MDSTGFLFTLHKGPSESDQFLNPGFIDGLSYCGLLTGSALAKVAITLKHLKERIREWRAVRAWKLFFLPRNRERFPKNMIYDMNPDY